MLSILFPFFVNYEKNDRLKKSTNKNSFQS